jgi:hypothetical protein
MKTTRMSTEADLDDVRSTEVKDRRAFDRLPPQFEAVTIRTKTGETFPAKVDNVSLGGIGLQMESSGGIAKNDAVDVIYLYAAMPATVRHVERGDDGKAVVGLKWKKPPVK